MVPHGQLRPMIRKASGEEIIRKLKSYLVLEPREFVALEVVKGAKDPFKLLIATVLSQNTSDRNSSRAFRRLLKSIGTSPEEIAAAPLRTLKVAIRPAGLFNVRARGLRELSRAVLEDYGGDLGWIRTLPLDGARRRLIELPHVGPKTADVLLLFMAGRRTFPIDTHVGRVSRRLGIVGERDGYEDGRRKLMQFFPATKYLEAHLLLIGHGRRTCRARRPLCGICVLEGICPFPKENPKYNKA
jgi:endonuclease-3